ncbi:MAG: hypothetical protein R3F11_01890 [Verrucomicrobiales bacterium]
MADSYVWFFAGGDGRIEMREHRLTQWMEQDPNAAAAWIRGYAASAPAAREATSAAEAIAAAAANPVEFAQSLPEGSLRLAIIAEVVARGDPANGLPFALAQSGVDREVALASVVQQVLQNPPDDDGGESGRTGWRDAVSRAMGALAELGDKSLKAAAANALIDSGAMAVADPAEAAGRVAPFADEGKLPDLASTLTAADAAQFSEWLTTFQAGPRRDLMIGGMIREIGKDRANLRDAAVWAGQIGDPDLRTAIEEQIKRAADAPASSLPHPEIEAPPRVTDDIFGDPSDDPLDSEP